VVLSGTKISFEATKLGCSENESCRGEKKEEGGEAGEATLPVGNLDKISEKQKDAEIKRSADYRDGKNSLHGGVGEEAAFQKNESSFRHR